MGGKYENIAARVWKLHQRVPVLPLLGIQYRLCEVGRDRIGQLQLFLAIERLLADGALVEASERVFVDSLETAQRLRGDIEELGRIWVDRPSGEHERAVNIITERICEQFNEFGLADSRQQPLGSMGSKDLRSTARSRYVDVNSPRLSATIWISWNEEAICPSQSAFWAFLEDCSNRGRVPIIVARAVTTLAFPVLKATGARAVQYYFVPTPLDGEELRELQEATGRFGLPPVRTAGDWGQLPFVNALRTQLEALSSAHAPVERARQALQVAVARGFSNRNVSPPKLRRWANDIEQQLGIKLPGKWKDALVR